MGRFTGKVALVTGAARGQGRSHAVRLAEEGADVIVVDVAEELPNLPYRTGTREDLDETVAQVERLDRAVIPIVADVRDSATLDRLVGKAVAELGRLDVVCANAGIGANPHHGYEVPEEEWEQVVGINLGGVWRTCKATIPHILAGDRGGSVVLTGSVVGLKASANVVHYSAAKHGVVGIMRSLARELAPRRIRVNSVHPTQVATPMILNDEMFKLFRPDLENPTVEDFKEASAATTTMGIPWVEPSDVTNAVLFLASAESRYITGVALPVDGGAMLL